jgi:hypothetical protein
MPYSFLNPQSAIRNPKFFYPLPRSPAFLTIILAA